MARIIKAWESSSQEYPSYERDPLEFVRPGPHQSSGGLALDPHQIVEEARREAEQKVREAYAEGLRRGTEAGQAAFAEAVGKSAAALEQAAKTLIEARERFLESLEPEVVGLAAAIAERILRREPAVDPERVRRTVREALTHLERREQITLRLNPADLAALEEQNVKLLEDFDAVEHLDVVADDTVAPGGCVAESEHLEVDAQIKTQFDKIINGLLE